MHGGYRTGSGRKTLSNKKNPVTIYLDDSEKEMVENSPLPLSTNFSQKCRELIWRLKPIDKRIKSKLK